MRLAASALRASANDRRRGGAAVRRCGGADALRIQALVAARKGRWEDALVDVEQAQSLAHLLSYPYAEAKALSVSGQLLPQRNEIERGSAQLAAARGILGQLGERLYSTGLTGPR